MKCSSRSGEWSTMSEGPAYPAYPAYPAIEPTTFDLIVVGTGLPESILAAAASAAGKSVLHIDPNPFYGSQFSSLSLPELLSFLRSHSDAVVDPSPPAQAASSSSSDHIALSLTARPLFSHVEASPIPPDLLNSSSKFCLDVSGPRVLFCAAQTIDLLMKSGVSQYLEFKSIDSSFIADPIIANLLSIVPDSRSAIFEDDNLSLIDKTKFWRFFQQIRDHLQAVATGEGGSISQQDLDAPFVDFLDKKHLSTKIKSVILYAIAMANYDQAHVDASEKSLKTGDGINRLALYLSSLGRFSNASGAMLYPMYGQGELPQAFCRRAAVKGCLYVLRMPVVAVLVDMVNARCKGIRLASGQDLFTHQLVLDPVFAVPQPSDLSLLDSPADLSPIVIKERIARGICISRQPLNSEASNLLVVYPPRSLYPEQAASIRVLQVGSGLAICPKDMFVWYLSALCSNADEGKKLLKAAIDALSASGSTEWNFCREDSSFSQSKDVEGTKHSLVWRTLYVQEVMEGVCGSVSSSFSPDGELGYNDLIVATQKMFRKLFPSDEFFPDEPISEDSNEDHGLDLEL